MTDNDNRGLLRVIKVPFDIKAIFLGGLGYILFVAGGWILNAILLGKDVAGNVISRFIVQGLDACSVGFGKIPLIGGTLDRICGTLYGRMSPALDWWEMVIVGVWFLLVLSIFGGAICRVVALRISRDESVGVVEALKFSASSLMSYVNIPVFLGLAIGFFVGCNALAGLTSSIPYLGPVLFILLYPLVILSAIIILLIAVGGLLGLFMMVAAVSTEKNGTLDAISRAFSYIYSRPVAYFFYSFLVFVVAGLIILIGHDIFLGTAGDPGIVAKSFEMGTVSDGVQNAFRLGADRALAVELPVFADAAGKGVGWNGIATIFAWFFLIVLKIGVLGFVVAYILGGSTAIYFALRKDVDGTEDSEIYVEGAEEEDDFGLPPVTPAEEKPADAPAAAPEEKKEEEEAQAPSDSDEAGSAEEEKE